MIKVLIKNGFIAAAFGVLAAPAYAGCEEEWTLLSRLIGGDDAGEIVDGVLAGSCIARDVSYLDDATAKEVTWYIPDLIAAVTESRMPPSATVRISGLDAETPGNELGELSDQPVDLSLRYVTSAERRELVIEEIAAYFEDGQSIELGGKLGNFDASGLHAMQMVMMQSALQELSVNIYGRDLMRAIVLPGIEGLVRSHADDNVSDVVASRDFIDSLPTASVDLQSRMALKTIADDAPDFGGGAELSITSETGITALTLLAAFAQQNPEMTDVLALLFDGAKIEVNYPTQAAN